MPDKRRKHSPKRAWESPREDGPTLIYGIHPVEAALANAQRTIGKLYLTDNAERRLHDVLHTRGLAHERVLPKDLDRRLGPDTVHQGALMETEPLPEPSLEAMAEEAAGRPLVVLDQVTDPHNVGAILRSAAVFGASGLMMTRRHSPPLDGNAGEIRLRRAGARTHRARAEPRPRARRPQDARLHGDRPR